MCKVKKGGLGNPDQTCEDIMRGFSLLIKAGEVYKRLSACGLVHF